MQNLHKKSFRSIPKISQCADFLWVTKVVIWDEIGAHHKYVVEALDRTLQDICNDNRPFEGITTILDGDFLQSPPGINVDAII